ncbi:Cobyrinic acid ac-diamide synthase [Methylobacterium sp. 4-46]|uniref:ParA family protein n=1 Tax=unclassified Methylobacterium TaxID=2615210 RepID=UPI000152E123|nr:MULTISPECIES: ParA family protein [Methylobacterium]ACA20630.1 Cobyrinic acid ac-diamide synthase [Methylobacterium sp. 4-46]WFT79794.1 ParA family protein [Methylobacterium nodulans]
MSARVLSSANCKGGTGKSTVAVNLAADLAAEGFRVLVIDLDPQGHAGFGFGLAARLGRGNSHAPLLGRRVDLREAVLRSEEDEVDLLPADRGFDGQITAQGIRCLDDALWPLRADYDLMLIDVPPAAAALTVCALMASDGVVIPTTLDPLGLEGVRQFARSYHRMMLQFGAAELGFAIAPMRIDLRSNVEKEVLGRLRTDFGPGQMIRGVRVDVAVSEAFARRRPLRRHRDRARAVDDFRGLAADVVRRFGVEARPPMPVYPPRLEGFVRTPCA